MMKWEIRPPHLLVIIILILILLRPVGLKGRIRSKITITSGDKKGGLTTLGQPACERVLVQRCADLAATSRHAASVVLRT